MALILADNEKYEVLDIIGRGAFGIIRKVRRKADGLILCRKEINYIKMSQKERDQLSAEFTILASLKHQNIVGYYHREHLKQTQELYMYMEYCGGGDLGTIIKDLKERDEFAKEDFIWRIFAQLITALYRCHYGVDPSEPGNDFRRFKDNRKLNGGKLSQMILHRDLKPENIFLGEDHSVKLGDFGLSKLMQSHDFASTYVGTPFYMSPEICAAEKYTLQSDIWSVGCIMYELCTREPPFNANSHLQLVKNIRKGSVTAIPDIYSSELSSIIMSCLRTNPTLRPDTATLIAHPFIWMARKQQEMVAIGKALKTREEVIEAKARQNEELRSALITDKAAIRAEIDAQLRREWEVKARLEIDNQVAMELSNLRQRFDTEVNEKVQELLAKHVCETSHDPSSSVNTAGEYEWASTTELTEISDLSIHSPTAPAAPTAPVTRAAPPKKTKTPFARSKTTFDSPADVHMSEPSPISISGLALSPRRNAAAQAAANLQTTTMTGRNLFAEATRQRIRWHAQMAHPMGLDGDKENNFIDSDDDDDIPELPSPTRPKGIMNTDPFKTPSLPTNPLPSKARPGMQRQHTVAATTKLSAKPSLFPSAAAGSATAQNLRAGFAAVTSNQSQLQSQIPRSATEADVRGKGNSPTRDPSSRQRRLSKIPSRNDLRDQAGPLNIITNGSTSPLRRAATTTSSSNFTSKLQSKLAYGKPDNPVAGRTRVELAQARAGGRPVSADFGGSIATATGLRKEKDLPPVPVWDQELWGEEMPSPFLKREVRTLNGRWARSIGFMTAAKHELKYEDVQPKLFLKEQNTIHDYYGHLRTSVVTLKSGGVY